MYYLVVPSTRKNSGGMQSVNKAIIADRVSLFLTIIVVCSVPAPQKFESSAYFMVRKQWSFNVAEIFEAFIVHGNTPMGPILYAQDLATTLVLVKTILFGIELYISDGILVSA